MIRYVNQVQVEKGLKSSKSINRVIFSLEKLEHLNRELQAEYNQIEGVYIWVVSDYEVQWMPGNNNWRTDL